MAASPAAPAATESPAASPDAAKPARPKRRVFGIRHHGPGSARSLLRALEETRPDCVLIEGPPDADALIPLAAHPDMRPPVALLVYDPEAPRFSAFYPFAEFSPEWVAIRWAVANEVPVRFIDLPQAHQLAERKAEEERLRKLLEEMAAKSAEEHAAEGAAEDAGDSEEADEDDDDENKRDAGASPEAASSEGAGAGGEDAAACVAPPPRVELDPLSWLARAAGHEDGERWWETMVEHRSEGVPVFEAIGEAIGALRAELSPVELGPPEDREREARREAHMRRAIRAAEKEFACVAVVCGAWHVPALAEGVSTEKADTALLKSLPKTKVAASWAPWSYANLARSSGYGAGIESPGYYEYVWRVNALPHATARRLAIGWQVKVARLLREEGWDASSASVIESVRLAETLCALRERPLPGLRELQEASQSVFLMGDPFALRVIGEKLLIGGRLGEIPDCAEAVPLQRDLTALQKSLRLKVSADSKDMDLDLRNETDMARSRLFHRLNLLGIHWAAPLDMQKGKGSFHEFWRLQWAPELAVKVIEASLWGTTVEGAASVFAHDAAAKTEALPGVSRLMRAIMFCDLPDAMRRLMRRLENLAAVSGDAIALLEAIPPLAETLRYGSVRKLDPELVGHVVDHLVARSCLALPGACVSLADEAAEEMAPRLDRVNEAIGMLDDADHVRTWRATLAKLLDQAGMHGLLAGRCCRILLDAGEIPVEEAARRMSYALSVANDPADAGWWIEGFLRGGAMLLLHSDAIWDVLDEWVCGMGAQPFDDMLPVLRRTFSGFLPAERRMMGQKIKERAAPAGGGANAGGTTAGVPAADAGEGNRSDGEAARAGGPPHARAGSPTFDPERARRVLPVLAAVLGLEVAVGPGSGRSDD